MKRLLLLAAICTNTLFTFGNDRPAVKAAFDARESTTEVLRQPFDTEADLTGWTRTGINSQNTWKLGKPKKSGVPDFNQIDPSSRSSLVIYYDDQNEQNETLKSPAIPIGANVTCGFYACFDGVWTQLAANFVLLAENKDTQQCDTLFDAAKWSLQTGHERHKWLSFTADLAPYAGQEISFLFRYKGIGGDDVYVDNFCIYEKGGNEVNITEGSEVHFSDLSEGQPVSWEWTFEGGEPATSTDQHPVVVYNRAGSYPVSLTVKNAAQEHSTITKDAYIRVSGIAPQADIALPEEGYLSPYAALFIPLYTPVTFRDASTGMPTAWQWDLTGATPAVSDEPNPAVKYEQAGTYSVKLTVSNAQGIDEIQYSGIQAGDTCHIWNISPEETDRLEAISLGWFGYYGGSNWQFMNGFAEYFHKPVIAGSLSEVDIFFDLTETITPDTLIRVSVATVENGLPGSALATASVPAGHLVNNPTVWEPTRFLFEQPVPIDKDFFIVVEGIPSNMDDSGLSSDNIAIAATRRNDPAGKSTVYHRLIDTDENDHPTGTMTWYKNSDEAVSFAIAPRFTYNDKHDVAIQIPADADNESLCPSRISGQLVFFRPDDMTAVQIADLAGRILYQSQTGAPVNMSSWLPGIYIVRVHDRDMSRTQKIQVIR